MSDATSSDLTPTERALVTAVAAAIVSAIRDEDSKRECPGDGHFPHRAVARGGDRAMTTADDFDRDIQQRDLGRVRP